MRVHQCPRCELRFREKSEVAAHLIDEHGVDPDAIEQHLSGRREGIHVHRRAPNPAHDRTSP